MFCFHKWLPYRSAGCAVIAGNVLEDMCIRTYNSSLEFTEIMNSLIFSASSVIFKDIVCVKCGKTRRNIEAEYLRMAEMAKKYNRMQREAYENAPEGRADNLIGLE